MNDTTSSIYDQIGGEATVRTLCQRFYQNMHDYPQAQGIRAMHAPDLQSSEDKLFKFLSGWLGGPSLYIQEYGHPRLRRRHMPFKIGESERDQWMLCMRDALNDTIDDKVIGNQLLENLYNTADFMRNSDTCEHAK